MIIYKATNKLNGKCYIGQTTRNLNVRKNIHEKCAEDGSKTKFHNAIKKYGKENFNREVVEIVNDKDKLNELETFYIRKFDSVNNGYNMYYGGYENPMFVEEIYERHSNKMRSPEVRKKISDSMKIVRKNESEEKRKLHNKNVSEGLKRFYAEGKKPNYKHPRYLTEEHKESLNESHYKEVYCVNEAGDIIKEFKCIRDAAKWWHNTYRIETGSKKGQPVAKWVYLMNAIKSSAEQNKFVQGLKWVYRV